MNPQQFAKTMRYWFVIPAALFLFTALGKAQDDFPSMLAPILADLIAGSNSSLPEGVTLEEWSACRSAADRYTQDLLAGSQYALQMFDASSKLPDGLFNGNMFSPGNWDECLAVRLPPATSAVTPSGGEHGRESPAGGNRGKYCALTASVNLDLINSTDDTTIELGDFLLPGMSVFVGACIPSQCSSEIFESALNSGLNPQGIAVQVARCVVDEPRHWTSGEIFGVTFFSFFGLLIMVSTAIEVANRHFAAKIDMKGNLGARMLDCFSIYTNTEKLVAVSKNPSEIGCLHGMRFITISWIILGHVYSEPPMYDSSINRWMHLDEWFQPGMQLILNSTMSVDTFFTISGFLVAYGLLKTLKKVGGKFPVIKFYVHRYLRLTPVYAAVVIASAFIVPLVGDGPLYKQYTDIMSDPCQTMWWQSLLYIANFWDMTWVCVPHAWYMSNDMQFYFISPLFILPLYFKPILGIIWLAIGLAGSIFAPIYVMYSRNLWGSIVGQHFTAGHSTELTGNFEFYYIKPWCRVGPYLVGIFLGYLFYRAENLSGGKRRQSTLPSWLVWSGWVGSTATCLACIFGLAAYFPADGAYMSLELNAWYTALHRVAWSVGISWIIYACAFGRGGPVHSFLSWTPFVPLGRLTYSAYLTHMYYVGWFKGTRQAGEYLDLPMQVFTFVGYHVCGHITGYLFCMAFESPFLRLERILLPWHDEAPKLKSKDNPAVAADQKIKNGKQNGAIN